MTPADWQCGKGERNAALPALKAEDRVRDVGKVKDMEQWDRVICESSNKKIKTLLLFQRILRQTMVI